MIIGPDGDGAGHPLQFPYRGLEVADDGVVYVTGAASNNAFAITPAGAITQIIDASGDGQGNVVVAPTGIAVDGAGTVYVGSGTGVFRIAPN